MKVLYIITQSELGGAQQYVLSLAKYFNGAIAAGTENKALQNVCEKNGLRFFPIPHLVRAINPWFDLLALSELYAVIKQYNPDIVHINSSKAGILGSIAGRALGKKTVFTAHGFQYLEPKKPLNKLFFLNIERSIKHLRNFVITVSAYDRTQAIADKVIEAHNSEVIPNGICAFPTLPKADARKHLGLTENAIIVGTIAHAYKTKGLDILLQSMLPLLQSHPLLHLCIIGKGPAYETLQDIVTKNNAEKQVHLPGEIPNAKSLLGAFDIFVLPSRKEGFPFVLLEAMHAGLPIIATKVGGNQEALGDSGILVPPEDEVALRSAILDLIASPAKQKDLASQSFARSKEFTEEKMLSKTKEVYTKVLL